MKLAVVGILLLAGLVGCSSSGEADVVLETDKSPLTEAEKMNIEGALGDIRDLALVGRVSGPQGESTLVTFGQGGYDSCYAVVEEWGYSSGCGDLEAPEGSVIVGQSSDAGHLGLIVDTAQDGITSVRVTTGTGESYEVAPLADLSFIAFDDTQSGFDLALIAGDKIVHQEG